MRHPETELPALFQSSPTTCAAALHIAAGMPIWSQKLEKAIVAETLDDDARVRAAAYRALASRDPEIWPVAWLAHEAVLDPDPLVRAAAPRK